MSNPSSDVGDLHVRALSPIQWRECIARINSPHSAIIYAIRNNTGSSYINASQSGDPDGLVPTRASPIKSWSRSHPFANTSQQADKREDVENTSFMDITTTDSVTGAVSI
ncbi:hypothetical protein KIN20_020269 [Parelaphostrongylus tenuis]|uniref:Uncharacterized protein n=1 Tax=Parelaphostrongylus tenuis TaxID=148309 RepID=A0AAD5QT47_PARTN|nr:hypothetical protein KIN20_020269 [Parelaphostrongylus tenuis]